MEQTDIWRAATSLLAQEGNRAPEQAGRRIWELRGKGDVAGVAMWHDILAVVMDLQDRRALRARAIAR